MNDTAVCFVNVHFAAHIEGNEKRIMEYKYKLKTSLNSKFSLLIGRNHLYKHSNTQYEISVNFRHIVKNIHFRRNGKTLFEHDAIFWFGDLNFRLDTSYGMSNNELRKLCNDDEAFRDMIIYDQVN